MGGETADKENRAGLDDPSLFRFMGDAHERAAREGEASAAFVLALRPPSVAGRRLLLRVRPLARPANLVLRALGLLERVREQPLGPDELECEERKPGDDQRNPGPRQHEQHGPDHQ